MKKFAKESIGIVKRHPDGFGFFISDDPEQIDVYIPRQSMKGVMANDRVRVSIERERGGDRFRGEIIEVVHRAVVRAVGQYHEMGPGRGLLYDKSFGWGEDLRVNVPPGTQVKSGDLVVVQIEDYPDSDKGFSGRLLTVIGDAADPINDSIRVLHSHSIPNQFSKASLKQADDLNPEVTEKDWAGRKDLRKFPIVTIDGKTAKDFDDAVYVEKTSSGFHLIVAIADVSHYVKEGSPIDDDAIERGTSTYFPGFVSPMLPEKLSNELCSLKPKVPRLALVADMNLSFQGDLVSSDFYEGVIQSHARVTYGQAQQLIEGAPDPELDHVKENILRCADLAKVLMAKRFREGSLDLELPETVIEIDEAGMPVDIMRSERLFSHRLIEELMLQANVAVAKRFHEKDIPALYRIHEQPAVEAIGNFETFLQAFGYDDKLSGSNLQKKISKALEHFRNHPKSHVLSMLALRSLAQAKYSPANVGHFGLGFEHYAHFTSPIRRYPDLIVHRLLKASMGVKGGYRLMSQEELETAGSVLSACEQRSVKAERQIHSIKKARFLSKYLGEEFEGLISSVTKFGLFVMLRQFDVDGLIRNDQLGKEPFEFDQENLRLVGKRSGFTYEIGELLKVVVAKTDPDTGQIDFVLPGGTLKETDERGRGGREGGRDRGPRGERGGRDRERSGRDRHRDSERGRGGKRSAEGGRTRDKDRGGERGKPRKGELQHPNDRHSRDGKPARDERIANATERSPREGRELIERAASGGGGKKSTSVPRFGDRARALFSKAKPSSGGGQKSGRAGPRRGK